MGVTDPQNPHDLSSMQLIASATTMSCAMQMETKSWARCHLWPFSQPLTWALHQRDPWDPFRAGALSETQEITHDISSVGYFWDPSFSSEDGS